MTSAARRAPLFVYWLTGTGGMIAYLAGALSAVDATVGLAYLTLAAVTIGRPR